MKVCSHFLLFEDIKVGFKFFTALRMTFFTESLHRLAKTTLSGRFWRFIKLVIKPLLLISLKNPFRGLKFIKNGIPNFEDFNRLFYAPVLERFEVKKLPIFFFQKTKFLPKSSKINKCWLFFKFYRQIPHFSPKVHCIWILWLYDCFWRSHDILKKQFFWMIIFWKKITKCGPFLVIFFQK